MEVKLKTGLVSTHAYSINNVVEVGSNRVVFLLARGPHFVWVVISLSACCVIKFQALI